jgi:hypothetical protein
MRRRGAALLRWQPPLTHIVLALTGFFNEIDVERSLPIATEEAAFEG